MATVVKRNLSGSTHGVGIAISATQGSTYTTVHALGFTATTTVDEIWLYAVNNFSQTINVALEVGISQSGMQIITPVLPQEGEQLILAGRILTGTACQILAFVNGLAGSASPAISGSALVSIHGYVNRLTQ